MNYSGLHLYILNFQRRLTSECNERVAFVAPVYNTSAFYIVQHFLNTVDCSLHVPGVVPGPLPDTHAIIPLYKLCSVNRKHTHVLSEALDTF